MTPTEVLQAARDLIADPDHWCQGALAWDGKRPVGPHDPEAVAWCVIGAIDAVASVHEAVTAKGMLQITTACPLEFFNDGHSHGDVIAAFDQAIEMLE